jgi:hypothetical protein
MVGVWQHCRVEDPPGGVISHVVNDNARVGRVGKVHENVIAASLILVLESVETAVPSSGPNNLVVNHQIRQQRVGS